MKAIIKDVRGVGLTLKDVPQPTIGAHEVLIKVHKSSICGTDLHIYKWDDWAQKTIFTPLIIGHEFMGEITALGNQVEGLEIGQRVSAEGHITCGSCVNCLKGKKHLCPNTKGVGVQRPGAFAEYISLPAENVFVLPDSVPDDLAAIFDPFGNAVHTALSFPLTGEDVLVTGAGPIGIMGALIAKHAGARRVVVSDVNEYRLELARKLGIVHTVNVSKESLAAYAEKAGIRDGFTVALEMSGSPKAFNSLLEMMQPGGKVALLGILPPKTEIDWDLVIFKMLTIKGIYGRKIFRTWQQMISLLDSGFNLKPIITHRFPASQFQEGFDMLLSGNSGKVILDW